MWLNGPLAKKEMFANPIHTAVISLNQLAPLSFFNFGGGFFCCS